MRLRSFRPPRSPAACSPRRAKRGLPRASCRGPGSSRPIPILALVYAFAKPGEPPRERLKRIKHLASLTPGDIEGHIAIANAAIEAHEWQEARAALEPYLEDRPPARICTLMARIEAGELGDRGREREWLGARLARAARPRLDRRRLCVGPLAAGLAGHRRRRCLRVEGAGRCHRPRRHHAHHRGAPRAAPTPAGRKSRPPALAPAEPTRRAEVVEDDAGRSRAAQPSPGKVETRHAGRAKAQACPLTCPTGRPTIPAWRKPIRTRARPRSSACARRKSADMPRGARAPRLASVWQWH